jgi:hypothetical protein
MDCEEVCHIAVPFGGLTQMLVEMERRKCRRFNMRAIVLSGFGGLESFGH